MLVKFEQNRIVQTTRNLSFLTEKWGFKDYFWQVDAILEDVYVALTIIQC